MFERLVRREAGPKRGDLEKHATGLAEVDRLEVVAIDDRSGPRAGRGHTFPPRRMIRNGRRPGDVMHGARAAHAAVRGSFVVHVKRTALLAAHLIFTWSCSAETEGILEQPAAAVRIIRKCTYAGEALQGKF